MPIIFAQAIMFIPVSLASLGGESMTGFATAFSYGGFWYNFVMFLMVIAFTYFYTAITQPCSNGRRYEEKRRFYSWC